MHLGSHAYAANVSSATVVAPRGGARGARTFFIAGNGHTGSSSDILEQLDPRFWWLLREKE